MPSNLLLFHPPATGAWNMAVDQALLEYAATNGLLILRLYQWWPATVSLGYFQRSAERASHSPSLPLPLVRRTTGGGAIVHDRELTYSLCVPESPSRRSDHRRWYQLVHNCILEILGRRQVTASLFCEDDLGLLKPQSENDSKQPFLCFQRRCDGDLILEGYKIGGSAQRRGRQAMLQHGSILLQQSEFAPELPGIDQLCGLSMSAGEFGMLLADSIARRLKIQFETVNLSENLMRHAEEVCERTFSAESWTNNR